MAKLSAAARKALPKSSFGLPGKASSASGKAKSGSYPMPDKNHARAAIVDAARAYNAGHITKAQENQIDAKARKVLGK